MERNGDWDAETTALTDYVNAFRDGEGGSMTADIEEFHERAISLLRESGGRMNSLTFGYKWEQQFGESLQAFARMQRLSVAEMLRQSNRFWVVDMQGASSSGTAGEEADESGVLPMQIFVLVEQKVGNARKGTRLGDELSMHGESEHIRQWKRRQVTGTLRRPSTAGRTLDDIDVEAQVVGLPADGAGAAGAVAGATTTSYLLPDVDEDGEVPAQEQVECIHLPRRAATEKRLSALLDALEPSIGGMDSRLGLRQMHVAWSTNCTCASSAVVAMRQLRLLQGQAKGRQVRRLEEQIRAFADVAQSGVSNLRGKQLAEVLRAVQGRTGYENLVKFVASRFLHSDLGIQEEAKSMSPADVASLVEGFAASQRDATLYRKLSSVCMQMPAELFSVDDIAHILEGFDKSGFRDKALLRHMASILQSGSAHTFTAHGIGSLASSLASGNTLDDAAFRALSAAAQKLTVDDYTPESLGVMMAAFSCSDLRDPPLFRHLTEVVRQLDASGFDGETVARIAWAASKSGKSAEPALWEKLGEVVVSLRCSAYTPDSAARIVLAFAEGAPDNERVFKYLSLVVKKMDAWTFEIDTVAALADSYSRAGHMDESLFARLSTVMQQIDAVSFSLSSIATVANAYSDPRVLDKALLGRLAMILQQMDGKVVSGPEAVQDVSVILNAYAKADMRETALNLSHILTNHLKPHVGGLTAQAMANIVLRVGLA